MFTEDVTNFIDTSDFADCATIDGVSVNGIFDREYIEVGDVSSLHPTFYCAWEDVTEVARGESVSLGDESYTVFDVQRDGIFCLLVFHNA